MRSIDQDNRRILIVDDNADIHQDYRKVLTVSDIENDLDDLAASLFGDDTETDAAGFELTSAFQGKEAYQLALDSISADLPFAMAFVDMRMPPGWDGLETIVQLWSVDPRIFPVICTAYSDKSWEQIEDTLGKDHFYAITKPFNAKDIKRIASERCTSWSETYQWTKSNNA